MAFLSKYFRPFFLLIILLPAGRSEAQNIPSKADNYVTDSFNYLDESEKKFLNDTLADFENRTSCQLFILLSDSLYGQNIDVIGPEIARKWGVGREGADNGMLISVFVKSRALRIDVGYGLEALVTDLETARIREKRMNPAFAKGHYFDGLKRGVFALMAQTDTVWQAVRAKESAIWRKKFEEQQSKESELTDQLIVLSGRAVSAAGEGFLLMLMVYISLIFSLKAFRKRFPSQVSAEAGKLFDDPAAERQFLKEWMLPLMVLLLLCSVDGVFGNFLLIPWELLDPHGSEGFILLIPAVIIYLFVLIWVRRKIPRPERRRLVLFAVFVQFFGSLIPFMINYFRLEALVESANEQLIYLSYSDEIFGVFFGFLAVLIAQNIFFAPPRIRLSGGGYSGSSGYSPSSGSSYSSRSSYSSGSSSTSSSSSSGSSSFGSSSSGSSSSGSSSSKDFGGGKGGDFGGGGSSGTW